MSEQTEDAARQTHRRLAADLFNFVWTLLDKTERTQAEEDLMVHAAHASCYHWMQVGQPVNQARGEWQIARVYAVLGRPEPARDHAQRCLDICQENGIGDFDLAYAYEALARASAVAGAIDARARYLALAQEAGERIQDADDKRLLLGDLATIP